jgi:hypothetical protein
MRVGVRTTRNMWVSLGPFTALVLGLLLLAFWSLVLVALAATGTTS